MWMGGRGAGAQVPRLRAGAGAPSEASAIFVRPQLPSDRHYARPSGEGRRPLTVVVVNNGGGGIFRFLPINGQLPAEDFTQLWETPTSGIDIGALCRAHGIPHQKVGLCCHSRCFPF